MMYSGVVIYAPAIAMEALIGAPVWMSLLAITLVATIYTTVVSSYPKHAKPRSYLLDIK